MLKYIFTIFYFLALPVELSKFETQLLLDENIAKLVDKSKDLKAKPTAEKLEECKADFESRLLGQEEALKTEKLRETERYMDKILTGKRKKLLKQGKNELGKRILLENKYHICMSNIWYK